ncbi:MAG: hypothetical protein M1541_18740 [Acidobacteria bacterium]|nr:hypothetical protein [Acidobacteriota bacterium]
MYDGSGGHGATRYNHNTNAMTVRGALFVWSLGAAMLAAQDQPAPPVLENRGQPMKLDHRCGEDDILQFGLTCDANEPCQIFLELSSVETAGNRVFLSGNFHTSSTTLASLLLASGDGGKSWREPHERLRGAVLDQMQFLDLEYGWIGGQTLTPLPRDPFLVSTRGGGKSWRRCAISSEPKVGAIAQFWFTSRTNGMLLVDRTQSGENNMRYELFETLTGGDSWAMRQASAQPIRDAKAFPGPRLPAWRLRVDTASRSYRLERRAGEGWIPVASFLIAAGECKAREQQPAEPAATPEPPVFQIPPRGGIEKPRRPIR